MQFRGYTIDEVHRTVTAPGGHVVRLEPKAFDLLIYFTNHPEETVSRERLIEDVWGGKFVTDDAVMVAVYALRQAFDDDSHSPQFIETIRGRGYRWIAMPSAESPKRAGVFAAVMLALVASGIGALVWAALRPPQPMPSITQTNALIRAHARGVFFSQRATRRDLEEARAEFRKAILVDDRFAEPHAALAEVCVRLIEIGAPDSGNEAEARKEAARALELAPRLAVTHAANASVQFVLDRDPQKAEQSFRTAIELDPSLPDAHRRYSYLLGVTGRFAEAEEQARIGAEMEPASPNAICDYAWTQVLGGHLADAQRLYRDALELDPANLNALFSDGFCEDLRNAPEAAMQSYRRAMQVRGVPQDMLARWDRLFATSGLPAVYGAWVDVLKPQKEIPRFMVAMYAARAGRSAEALALLHESAQRHEPAALWIAVHPAFASVRDHREFATLAASSFHTR